MKIKAKRRRISCLLLFGLVAVMSLNLTRPELISFSVWLPSSSLSSFADLQQQSHRLSPLITPFQQEERERRVVWKNNSSLPSNHTTSLLPCENGQGTAALTLKNLTDKTSFQQLSPCLLEGLQRPSRVKKNETEGLPKHKELAEDSPVVHQHKTGNETITTTKVGSTLERWWRANNNISHHAAMHIPDYVIAIKKKSNNPTITTTSPKIPVVVWPLWEFGAQTAASMHIEKNGIEESLFLKLSDDIYNFDPNVVWIGDTGYAYGRSKWCEKFNEHILTAQTRRVELGLPTSWPIYIVDWTDGAGMQRCKDVEETVGGEFVFYATRSIVVNRRWDEEKGWVEEGRMLQMVTDSGIKYRHTPMIVRTDTIENLQSELRERGFTLRDRIETLDRPVDVAHFWPFNLSDPNSKVGAVASKLRTKVSNIIVDMSSTTGLNVFVGTAGKTARKGRQEVSSSYVDALLNTKIVVVTQRDKWEDHYRLFEALISGALVFTDHMISLPAGLKNGTSVIEFGSEEQLRSQIEYYMKNTKDRLAIAREGRRVSMTRHRSWHRIEEIVFGTALTACSDDSTADCPYIVHANETSG